MRSYLIQLSEQVSEAVSLGARFAKTHRAPRISKILFCGLGGSAISGEILKVLFDRSRMPFEVNRGLRLPGWVDSKTLVICSSYSGNTEEVLALFGQAVRRSSKLLAVTSGGRLSRNIRAQKQLEIRLPGGIPPRCAVGYLTFSLIQVFDKWSWLKFPGRDYQEIHRILRRNLGKTPGRLARLFLNRPVRLYGSAGFSEPVLTRWQNQLAENAKVFVSHRLVPEMLHNEIEGYSLSKPSPEKPLAVFFRDREDPHLLERKIQYAKRLIKKSGSRILEIHSQGSSLLARLFSLIHLGDWVSYELALLRRVDPLEIPNITALKRQAK